MERPDRVFTPMAGVDWNWAAPYRDRHRDRISTRPAPCSEGEKGKGLASCKGGPGLASHCSPGHLNLSHPTVNHWPMIHIAAESPNQLQLLASHSPKPLPEALPWSSMQACPGPPTVLPQLPTTSAPSLLPSPTYGQGAGNLSGARHVAQRAQLQSGRHPKPVSTRCYNKTGYKHANNAFPKAVPCPLC